MGFKLGFCVCLVSSLAPFSAHAVAQRGWGRPQPGQPAPVAASSVVQVVPPAPSSTNNPSTTEGLTTTEASTTTGGGNNGACPGGVQFSVTGAFTSSTAHGYSCSGGSPATCCLSGSGAWFFPHPGGGTSAATIIECTISGDGENWCNISLIDGYSVPIQCVVPGGPTIGGTKDLFDNGPCPGGVNGDGNCPNPGGHTNSASSWFTDNGGYYYYQDNVGNVQPWNGNTGTVQCTVGAVSPKMKARDFDPAHDSLRAVNETEQEDQRFGFRLHGHAKRAHARSLELVS